ncbi:hypothetical protein JG688_00013484 [Phytophthora aleatoria]|uniref:Uncharacterized protein n=1 Tax=Phytophthora aleatoria TaxID=2496075 RepID=A0A8J5I927_9STRA|nr:hypothetical protein JG688_00013484 [Phytophthora aleatoria]
MSAKPKTPTKARRALLRLRGYVASRCLSLCWGTYVLGLIWLLLHPAITVTTGIDLIVSISAAKTRITLLTRLRKPVSTPLQAN